MNQSSGWSMETSGWKSLDEQKSMEIPELGFEIVKENKIMMPHPLKEYLGVEVCYIKEKYPTTTKIWNERRVFIYR
jgi:hypothetical protein